MNAVSTAPGRILVVDDDQAICLVVSEALRRAGHEVKTAGTIADRASLLGAFRPAASPAPARSWSRARCTPRQAPRRTRSSPSTWRRSRAS
jgi:hypothetical protein